MKENICFVAVAGSGKTTHLVEMGYRRLQELKETGIYFGQLAYVTFTTNNQANLQNRLRSRIGMSSSIVVLGWYQFLLKNFISPYKRDVIERLYGTNTSVSYAIPPTYKGPDGKNRPAYKKGDLESKFLDSVGDIYKDHIAEFALECIQKNKTSLQKYLPEVYDAIYIDEAQDLSGYDFEILKFLIKEVRLTIVVAGDPKQTTYTTANTRKNKGITFDAYFEKNVNTRNKAYVNIDRDTLIYTHRCIETISTLASRLYPNPSTITCRCAECEKRRDVFTHRLRGLYLVQEKLIHEFIRETEAAVLRWDKRDKYTRELPCTYNMGEVKGLEFDAVLISPTEKMLDVIKKQGMGVSDLILAKLYVAVTRPRYILGLIVPNSFSPIIEGFSLYTPV